MAQIYMPNPPKDIVQNQSSVSSLEDSELKKYHKAYKEENIIKHSITVSNIIKS